MLRRIFFQKLESLNLDPRLKKLLLTYKEVFGALPPHLSRRKLVQMDLKLEPKVERTRVRRPPYPAPQKKVEEIERQIQECIDPGLLEEYKRGDYPHHCSPGFLVAKPGSTALRLDVDYGEVNKPRTTQGVFLTWKYPGAYCQMRVQDQNGQTLWFLAGGPNCRSSGAAGFYNP